MSKAFWPDDLKTIRRGQRYSLGAAETFFTLVDKSFTDTVLGRLPSKAWPKSMTQYPHSYAYRVTLCAFLAALLRVAEGNLAGVTVTKFRNDIADAYYVAAALFFDGLWTNDRRAGAILGHAKAILRLRWGVECCVHP